MYGFYPTNANGNYYNYSPQTPQDERIWVQNEMSADAYLVAPNGFVRLWDAQKPVFYEKRADATGRPLPLETYEYVKKVSACSTEPRKTSECSIDYAEEIKALNRRIDEIEKGMKHEQFDADDSTV